MFGAGYVEMLELFKFLTPGTTPYQWTFSVLVIKHTLKVPTGIDEIMALMFAQFQTQTRRAQMV